jgi:hypothetical protein
MDEIFHYGHEHYVMATENFGRPVNPTPTEVEIALVSFATDHVSWMAMRNTSIFIERLQALVAAQQTTIDALTARLVTVEAQLAGGVAA